MTTKRNPMKDRVAIAGAATTGFTAANTGRSRTAWAAEACIKVLQECGLHAADVDGIVGSTPEAPTMQAVLGIPEVTFFATPAVPFVNHIAVAAAAVHSGLCDVVLAYHGAYRLAWNTSAALRDPFRRSMAMGAAGGAPPPPESVNGAIGYTAWASRYLHEFEAKGVKREHFGLVSVNDRTNAGHNPGAAMRAPITLDDYLEARMIRWPLCLLDMDVAVDGADALVIATAERAKDLPHRPVLINAVTLGMTGKNQEDQTPSLRDHGQHVVVKALRERSDFWTDGADLYYPYDGFTPITLNWFENSGWCGPGEAGAFLEQHWDLAANRIVINSKVPVNTHGGALSEGATQGSGHVREAVLQLQGRCGDRQVAGVRTALITAGGFFFNAQGLTLRSD